MHYKVNAVADPENSEGRGVFGSHLFGSHLFGVYEPLFVSGGGASEILPTLRIQSRINEDNLGHKIRGRGRATGATPRFSPDY